MAKIGIESAFHNIVHPDDYHLLGFGYSTTCLIFLGIVVDTGKYFELHLPAEKLTNYAEKVGRARYKFCKKKDLESLVGHTKPAALLTDAS